MGSKLKVVQGIMLSECIKIGYGKKLFFSLFVFIYNFIIWLYRPCIYDFTKDLFYRCYHHPDYSLIFWLLICKCESDWSLVEEGGSLSSSVQGLVPGGGRRIPISSVQVWLYNFLEREKVNFFKIIFLISKKNSISEARSYIWYWRWQYREIK